jgi:serine/threonine protein kinase
VALRLPEVALLYPALCPLHLTAAQHLPVRSLAHHYTEVRDLPVRQQGRHELKWARLVAAPGTVESSSGSSVTSSTLSASGREEQKGGREVVLKRFALAQGKGTLKSLRCAAHILARLQHPNIISLRAIATHYDEQHGPVYYLELPRLPMDLREWLLEHREREVETEGGLQRVVELLRGLCQGLHAIHSVGIIHRDLKPDNVLLNDQVRPSSRWRHGPDFIFVCLGPGGADRL